MANPFLGQIQAFGFNFAPRGWAVCQGQILPISQNQSLYSLLGTTYGGDGRTSFALPDLRGRVPIHVGDGFTQGQKGGAETVTLTVAEIAAHTHKVGTNNTLANSTEPENIVLGRTNSEGTDPISIYHSADPATLKDMNSGMIANTGGGLPHDNIQPYLTLYWCISLQGQFPSRN